MYLGRVLDRCHAGDAAVAAALPKMDTGNFMLKACYLKKI
jgi:hypothetical protein